MQGLMQDWPLTVDKILDHAKEWHGDREVVSRSVEGPIVRTNYADIHNRAKRLSNALLGMGISADGFEAIKRGSRISGTQAAAQCARFTAVANWTSTSFQSV
mgnify:CR=1 FL=1